jgi:hypothetical protein
VRITGWAARDGARAELLPAVGLSDTLTGVVGDGNTLFVALARLTAEPHSQLPLTELVSVRADGARELEVRWSGGAGFRARLGASGVEVTVRD